MRNQGVSRCLMMAAGLVFSTTVTSSCAGPPGADEAAPADDVIESSSALSTGPVSFRRPDGLILSTGNLYFTSHDSATASVWRMAQTASPGQEILLYSEAGARFGDIVFANVGGAFFGYFFATRDNGVTITIRRVPLTGGAAVTISPPLQNIDIANSHRNLLTDGVSLYWQDVSAVRKMPIGGGAVTMLDATTPDTPTAGIELRGDNIVYASARDIRTVPTGGTNTVPSLRTIATVPDRVTALLALSNGVYWGEFSGAVRFKVGSTTTTLWSTPGPLATSISSNGYTVGGAVSWSACGSSSCAIHFAFPAGNFATGAAAGAFGVSMNSSGQVFWGDAAGVHRQVF